jgi:hypothetical protein
MSSTHPHHSAFFEFSEVCKTLAPLSERQQLLQLKYELFHALERAHDFQSRARTLETSAEAQNAFGRHAQAELAATTREYEKKIRTTRLELVAAQTSGEVLEELCQDLLLTIQQAAERETGETLAAEIFPQNQAVSA